jgi:hypothetical protein
MTSTAPQPHRPFYLTSSKRKKRPVGLEEATPALTETVGLVAERSLKRTRGCILPAERFRFPSFSDDPV